jgi:hypothetical protein
VPLTTTEDQASSGVLVPVDLLNKLVYIATNPVADHLVAEARTGA